MHQTAFSERNLLIKCTLAVVVFLMVAATASLSHAELYCDPRIKARSEQDRQNEIMKDIGRFETAYGSANSFNSLYCGSQINSEFDQIGSNLVGGLDGQVNCLINSIFQKACKASIAPVQNAASQACTPNYSQSYFDPNLINNLFNQSNQNSTQRSDPAQALICLTKLVVLSMTTDIHSSDITNCLYGTLNNTDLINCLIYLFSQSKIKTITPSDLMICLNKSSTANKPNYCPGTQLNSLTPLSQSPGFNGGGGGSYPELYW